MQTKRISHRKTWEKATTTTIVRALCRAHSILNTDLEFDDELNGNEKHCIWRNQWNQLKMCKQTNGDLPLFTVLELHLCGWACGFRATTMKTIQQCNDSIAFLLWIDLKCKEGQKNANVNKWMCNVQCAGDICIKQMSNDWTCGVLLSLALAYSKEIPTRVLAIAWFGVVPALHSAYLLWMLYENPNKRHGKMACTMAHTQWCMAIVKNYWINSKKVS